MNVTIYSTPTCHFCHMTKAFLKEKNVTFTDIDISKDQEKAKEAVEKSGQLGVPIVDVDGEIIVGFNKPALIKALNL